MNIINQDHLTKHLRDYCPDLWQLGVRVGQPSWEGLYPLMLGKIEIANITYGPGLARPYHLMWGTDGAFFGSPLAAFTRLHELLKGEVE